MREPEYNSSSYAQELYHGLVSPPTNNSCYYQQAIYEDEGMDYAAPYPVYAPVLGKAFGEVDAREVQKLFES